MGPTGMQAIKAAGSALLVLAMLVMQIPASLIADGDDEALIKRINAAYADGKRLESIQDITLRGEVKLETAEGPQEMGVVFFAQRPNRLKIVTDVMPHVEFIQAFDGKNKWMAEGGDVLYMPEEAAEEMEFLAFTIIDGWLHYQEKGIQITPLEGQILGEQGFIILGVKDRHGNFSRYYYDKSTLLLARVDRQMMNAKGKHVHAKLFFEDYRNFHGLNIACTVRAEEDEKIVWGQTIEAVTLNSGFPEGFFTMPQPPEPEEEAGEEEKDKERKDMEEKGEKEKEKSKQEEMIPQDDADAMKKE